MNSDLFADLPASVMPTPLRDDIAPGVVLLRNAVTCIAADLVAAIAVIVQEAPFRHMSTAGGFRMSVAMTNCGALGWTSDRRGYRYTSCDPDSGRPWPAMPATFRALAERAADDAGFPGFAPDACLINRYGPGAKMSLHQDRDERDFAAPIISVSLGLPVVFLLGGEQRLAPTRKIPLGHGDVLVWGGPARMRFHGVLPLKAGDHPLTGAHRINLTFRKAG